MTELPAIIWVKHQAPGFHNWPDAPINRDYLAARHRHVFHVEVHISVAHDDREVEFHDLLDFVREAFPGGELGAQSCEMMARDLGKKIALRFGRACEVSVSEDGGVGSTVPSPLV